jgi:glycosyltransferase involved in cell wall biosynthesis
MRRVVFAVPGELTIPTGGFTYDRRIIAELRTLDWHVEVINLGDGFPHPAPDTRASALMLLAALPPDDPIVIDGLALGALPEVAAALNSSHDLIALVHHPLALEAGLPPQEADALRTSERRALADVQRVIVTSAFTARLISSDYGMPLERVTVVRPGNDRVAPAHCSNSDATSLLAVGALVPRKGYDVLITALASLRDLPWRATVVGDCTRDIRTAAALKAEVRRLALEQQVTFAGAVSAEHLASLYAAADLFVLASRFEGYGMAFAEAIAYGLPVVGTTAGAIVETVPAGTGILVSPDDVAALSAALRQVIVDTGLRQRLAMCARAFAAELPTWRQSAELFSQTIATAP